MPPVQPMQFSSIAPDQHAPGQAATLVAVNPALTDALFLSIYDPIVVVDYAVGAAASSFSVLSQIIQLSRSKPSGPTDLGEVLVTSEHYLLSTDLLRY